MVISTVNFGNEGDMTVVELKNNIQKRKIIKQLFLYGAMANTDLGKYVKLSTPKIISLLNELKTEGFVEELGQGNSSGGRPAKPIWQQRRCLLYHWHFDKSPSNIGMHL